MQGFISSVGNIVSGGQGGAGESFVKLVVDLTNITPTTETVNSKEYNKFTFNKTNLTFKTVTPLGDEETVAVDDALIYKLFPISNNNDDKGINISYDGATFSGYVLAQESTLTTVTFMFTYYIILSQTSVVWQNYVDMVFSNNSTPSSSNVLHRKILTGTTTWTVEETITSNIYIIGAGGGGGGGTSSYTGGGGSSGEIRIFNNFVLSSGYKIEAECGAGGDGGISSSTTSNVTDGAEGNFTRAYIRDSSNTVLYDIIAYGGGNGKKGASANGNGGALYFHDTGYGATGSYGQSSHRGGEGGLTPFLPYGCGGNGGRILSNPTSVMHGRSGKQGAVIIDWMV